MASPLDRLQSQFQIGGQIGRTSAEEVQSLAAKSGRQAPPIQPMETAVIGGTPSQAKMAGSSANLQRSLKVSAGEQELPTYLRRLQAARPLLEEEQERITRAKAMGQLNSLEERVQAAALATINAAPSAGAVLNVNDDEFNKVAFVSPADKATARGYLSLIASGRDKDDEGKDVYAPLASLLGFGPEKSLDDIKKDIQKYLTDPTTEMGKAAASGTPDQLLVSQINPQELGFNNLADIATLLKLPPEMDIGSLTIEQLTDQIAKVQAEEYSRTSALLRIINDPNVGLAEKEAARRQLEQLGATGIIAAEADVSNLASQIDDINTVTIAGREYTLSELLSDKTVTSLVNDYLKNPERAASIKETAPAFAAWIDSNKVALEKAVGKIDPGIQAVAATIENNNKLQRPSEGLSLKDGVMSVLYGDRWKTSTTALEPPAIYNTLRTFPSIAIRQNLTNLMNSLENRPEDLRYLAELSQEELQSKGLLTVEGIQRYQNYVNSSYNLANADTTDSIIGSIFGDEIKQPELEKLLSDVKALNDSNIVDDITSEQEQLLSIFDSNKDGKIDDTATLLQNAKSVFAGKSLKDLVNGSNDIKSGSDLLSSLRQKIDAASSNPTFIQFSKVLADGKIDDADINSEAVQTASIDDLDTLIKKGVPGATKLQSIIDSRAKTQAAKIYGSEVDSLASSEVGSYVNFATMTSFTPWNAQNEANWSGALQKMLDQKNDNKYSGQSEYVVKAAKAKYNSIVTKMQIVLNDNKKAEYERRKAAIERNKNAYVSAQKGIAPGSFLYKALQQRIDKENEYLSNLSADVNKQFARQQNVIAKYKDKF